MACDDVGCYVPVTVGGALIILILLATFLIACCVYRRQQAKRRRVMVLRALLERTNTSNVGSRRSSIGGGTRGYQSCVMFNLYTPVTTPPNEQYEGVT